MDLSTVIGFVIGVGLIGFAIFEGTEGKPMIFIVPAELAIVLGGATAATLISFPLKSVLSMGKVLKQAFFEHHTSPAKLIGDIVSYAEIARRDGILSLENVVKDIKDEFLVRGIQMAVDGSDPELIEKVLSSELDTVQERHETGRALFETLGKYAPSFGMVGTLIGLVLMFKNMDDPKKIGPGMSMALLCTFYGALLANLVALPLADKLKIKNSEELLHKEIVIRGVMAIQSGDNPRIVEQKLKTFLSPKERRAMEAVQSEAA
ncbi:MAG: motility protein A [Phycisphaerae bacterium]|nr:motility protein A [Phycisphaerae bacterium]